MHFCQNTQTTARKNLTAEACYEPASPKQSSSVCSAPPGIRLLGPTDAGVASSPPC